MGNWANWLKGQLRKITGRKKASIPTETFGQFFRRNRLERCMGLREFCLKYRYSPGNISRLERGVTAPPKSHKILSRYARHLGLEKGTVEWDTFFALAALVAGRIPKRVLTDKELVGRLPLIFTPAGGKRLTKQDMRGLIDKIKAAWVDDN